MFTGLRHVRPRPQSRFAAYDVPSLLVLLALGWLTLVSVTHPNQLSLTHSNVLSAAIATGSLLIALAATYVALTEFLLYGMLSSLFIGLAFLVFAAGHVGLRLVPLLVGWERHLNWTTYGWGIEDAAAGGLLLAAGLLADRVISLGRRERDLALGVLSVLAMAVLVTLWIYHAANSNIPHAAETFTPLIGAILFFAASALFWRQSKQANRAWFFWLSLSLTLAGFAQFQYAIHRYPLDVVQPGDILRLVFFTGILFALAAEWSQNYRGLRWQARELAVLHALTNTPGIHDVGALRAQIERVAGDALLARARVVLTGRGADYLVSPNGGDVLGHDSDSNSSFGVQSRNQPVPPYQDGRNGEVVLGVPLDTTQGHLGFLVAVRDTTDDFSTHDVKLLRAFGAQASILLERSLLYEEIEAGAILQERSRLAREIHDGLAQNLAFLKMRVAWLKRSPAAIEASQLDEIEGVLETALIEARHAITTLRSEPQTSSAVEAITRYCEEFGQVSDINVDVHAEERVPEVGPKARVELLRVVQEALNNVRKHANASNVTIHIEPGDPGVRVSVEDDGSGFDVQHGEQGHFGLEIMKERAESVGGHLTVSSTPNVGTAISICVPSGEFELEPSPDEHRGLLER
jgi:signal transduction histidine kinase